MSWLCEYEPQRFHRLPAVGVLRARAPRVRLLRALRDPRNLVLVASVLGSSMASIDASAVNVALPTIGRDLHLGLVGRQWVFLSYSLVLASFYLPAGGIADRVGQRRVFVAGALGFAAASALAGAAPNGGFLIGVRALQGLAGAFLITSSLAYLRVTFGRESGRAVGLWTAWSGITTIVGPPLGGALVQWTSWRLIFYINLPLAAAIALLARHPEPPRSAAAGERRPFDLGGALLLAAGFALITYGLVEVEARGLAAVSWAIVLGVVALVAALVLESRLREPMLPLALFRHRNFAVANGVTLLVYGALGGSTFYLVLYLQTVIGYSPFKASLVMLPVSLVMLALAGRFGRLADQHGPRLYLTAGPALMAASILLWSRVDDRSSVVPLALGVAVFALGLSMTVAPITATALSSAPERLSGIAAGVNNTVSRLGGLIAVAVMGLVISVVFSARAPHTSLRPLADAPTSAATRAASIEAFRAALYLAVGLCLAAALAAALGISDDEAKTDAAAE